MSAERQYFWRCAHHPSAITNFFALRTLCTCGCHTHALRWHDNGTHQLHYQRHQIFDFPTIGERP